MKKKLIIPLLLLVQSFVYAQVTTKTYLNQVVDFRTHQGVKVVGYSNPIKTRTVLEAVEKDLVIESFPGFSNTLFLPNTPEKAQQIQQIRQANWATVNGLRVKDQELLVTKKVLNNLSLVFPQMTISDLDYCILNYTYLKEVWATSNPSVNRIPRLKRIVVVDETLASTDESRADIHAGWQVYNTTDFSYWANDVLVGDDQLAVSGDIPYDIDSRWVLTYGWLNAVQTGGLSYVRYKEAFKCGIDYGFLHELSHHLPVGDHYVYAPAGGAFELPNVAFNKTIFYPTHVQCCFLADEHMSNPLGEKLSAFTSYQTLLWHKLNPLNERNPQKFDVAAPSNDVPGHYFYDQVQIKLENLQCLGLQNVVLMKESGSSITPTSNYTSQNFNGSTYTVTLSRAQQDELFPTVNIALEKEGVLLPVIIPRIVLETAAWKALLNNQSLSSTLEIKIDVKQYAGNVLQKIKQLFVDASSSNQGTAFRMYVYNTAEAPPTNIFADYTIDNSGNKYAIGFDGASEVVIPCTSGIAGPGCVQSGVANVFTVTPEYPNPYAISWWVQGNSVIQQDPTNNKKATITMSQYNGSYVTVNVGINYPAAPWYQSFQKVVFVNNCSNLKSSEDLSAEETGQVSMQIRIFDLNGKEIAKGMSSDPIGFFTNQPLEQGMYIVQTSNENGYQVMKLMK